LEKAVGTPLLDRLPRTVLPEGFDGVVLDVDPSVRRSVVAGRHKEPDPVTRAFIGLLGEAGCEL
jgi:hypothetical protein